MTEPCSPLVELRNKCTDKTPVYHIYRALNWRSSSEPAFVGECTIAGERVHLLSPGAATAKAARVQLAMLMLEHLEAKRVELCRARVVEIKQCEVVALVSDGERRGSVRLRGSAAERIGALGTEISISIARAGRGCVNSPTCNGCSPHTCCK